MDYSQFGKMFSKIEEMQARMKHMDKRLEQIAEIMKKSSENINTTLLRIEQIIDAYIEHSFRNSQKVR